MTTATNHPSDEGFTELPGTAEELAAATKPADNAPEAPATPAVNPKYTGKTVDDLIRMHGEAESKIGTQGQEIGHYRQLTDQLLDLKRNEDLRNNGGEADDELEISGDELLTNPVESIDRVVDQRVRQIEDRLAVNDAEVRKSRFLEDYPEAEQDITDPKFLEYIEQSNYRSSLAEAARGGSYEAAEDLWSGYEEFKGKSPAPADDPAQAQALADAAMVSAAGGGSGGSAPIYSRQALINKRIQDPSGYYDGAFQSIIQAAYREGRVR